MQEAYLDIYGVPTRVQTWGRWVEESYTKPEPENIVLCIPGNPGLAFIDTYVPKNARIHFVGHSIGAYIILEILKKSWIRENTDGAYLLFPAIEYMAQTKNGWYMVNVIQYLVRLILLLTWIFTLLPFVLQYLLIKGYIIFYSVLNTHLETIIDFLRPDVLDKVFYLAVDEMYKVKERATNVLLENKRKIKLYYGANDRWSPQKYCKQLKRDIPDIDAEICTRNFEHAFVLRHPEQVAVMVSSWIKH
ncbi:hypothetical protein RI129_009357 [Pyrocoelia pectoralis]|uniref:Lipid droplet-associated hydrolase n=1 Tax=Pyrocoelia pectoralis TaxID=417401 RepID=A0AAN7V1R0_9COLE